jgi:chromosomal replication initiation ATPase DnaA
MQHHEINNVVAMAFDVDPDGIAGKSKKRKYVDPRKVAYFIHWKFNQLTLDEIKRLYHRRAHSGILQMLQGYWTLREINPEFASKADQCIKKFKPEKTVLSRANPLY